MHPRWCRSWDLISVARESRCSNTVSSLGLTSPMTPSMASNFAGQWRASNGYRITCLHELLRSASRKPRWRRLAMLFLDFTGVEKDSRTLRTAINQPG